MGSTDGAGLLDADDAPADGLEDGDGLEEPPPSPPREAADPPPPPLSPPPPELELGVPPGRCANAGPAAKTNAVASATAANS
jgi:hypothetical protein